MRCAWIAIGVFVGFFASSLAQGAEPDDVLILVAASANDAVKEIAREFEKQSGATVKISGGPSQALANQIIQGARRTCSSPPTRSGPRRWMRKGRRPKRRVC